jgi:hypothetical protein
MFNHKLDTQVAKSYTNLSDSTGPEMPNVPFEVSPVKPAWHRGNSVDQHQAVNAI